MEGHIPPNIFKTLKELVRKSGLWPLPPILKGELRVSFWWLLGNLERIFKREKKLIERNKHFPYSSKCHSSDSIRAGVRPLDIKKLKLIKLIKINIFFRKLPS